MQAFLAQAGGGPALQTTTCGIMENTVNPGGKITTIQRKKDGSKKRGSGYGKKEILYSAKKRIQEHIQQIAL